MTRYLAGPRLACAPGTPLCIDYVEVGNPNPYFYVRIEFAHGEDWHTIATTGRIEGKADEAWRSRFAQKFWTNLEQEMGTNAPIVGMEYVLTNAVLQTGAPK